MEQWHVDLVERLARIEENQKFMRENIAALPQSPECKHDIAAIRREVGELNDFKDAINRKIAYVGGVIVAIGTAAGYILPSLTKWAFNIRV